jgi:bifunctional UDP-N-acetylglucosamine pyrophosphorylase/glucosamine-1-phosphate N-acetyltransferase
MSTDLHIVILAAGKGTRMKSEVPKVLHRISGRSLIEQVLRTADALEPATSTLVVGHGASQVRDALASQSHLQFVVQDPQLGTGHALLQTAPLLRGKQGTLLLLSGDVPLLTSRTLAGLTVTHRETGAMATVLTAVVDRPYGYGRIVRTQDKITRIVEERDASRSQREIKEINSGIYAFAIEPLFDALEHIGSDNSQGEYYLPDLVAIYRKRRKVVSTYTIENASEIRGINSRSELAEVSTMVRQQKNEELMAAGVTMIDPATTYIDSDVEIAADTVIHPCVFIEGSTRIGAACEIHSGSRIVNSTIGDHVLIRNHSVITESNVANGVSIGPFAHLRPGADIGADAHIGNFVELKKTTLGARSKANHLSYLGDATIGTDVNIGAGTITCNYDGKVKTQTVIEDGAFVGSDATLVAPVKVGQHAYIGAGSTITDDVPAGALAIGRGRQENKPGWVDKKNSQSPVASSKKS